MVQELFQKKVHLSTVCRSLRTIGMRAVVKKKKPLLTFRHRKRRLDFARKYENYTIDDWKRVIWSDETKVNRFQSDGLRYTWKSGRNYEGTISDTEICPTVKFGGGSVMMWGCMSARGTGGFCRIYGSMDADLYVDILRGELMQTLKAHKLDVHEIIFQQDNDPKHTSKKATAALEDLGLEVLDWPPQSPDLNPIEELWRVLKLRLGNYKTMPAGVEELWERIQKEWQEIPTSLVVTLIESMPARIRAVIRAKGGSHQILTPSCGCDRLLVELSGNKSRLGE